MISIGNQYEGDKKIPLIILLSSFQGITSFFFGLGDGSNGFI